MLVHLEKAHDLPVNDLEFVRQVGSNKQGAVWMSVVRGVASRTLVEAEFSPPEPQGDPRPIPGAKAIQPRTNESAPNPPVGTAPNAASWTPAAMQKLYGERDMRMA